VGKVLQLDFSDVFESSAVTAGKTRQWTFESCQLLIDLDHLRSDSVSCLDLAIYERETCWFSEMCMTSFH
jgi:hypothetical protein